MKQKRYEMICKEYEIGIVSLIDHKHQEAKA